MKDMINNEQKYPISQKVKVDANVMKKLMEDLERGQKSTQMIRNIILQQNYSSSFVKLEDYLIALDHHSMVALHTYANSLAMLKDCLRSSFYRKASDQLKATSFEGPCKSQVFANQIFPTYTKRRKIGGKSKEKEVTHVTDDGFVWRKYGQKMIHDCLHPRHYYRCTHKDELKCEATKQIQQISENPTKYKLIYNNNHTCKKKTSSSSSPYIINDSIDEYSSSAIVLSFDGSNTMNTMLFQEATTHDHTTSISEETKQMNPMIITKTSEASSSSNAASEQSDEHTSMQVVEINNNHFSTSCSVNFDEDHHSFMAEFCELFPDWWTPF